MCKIVQEYPSKDPLPRLLENDINPKSTGLFPPSAALGGGGCFPPPSVRLDPDILESWNLQGW